MKKNIYIALAILIVGGGYLFLYYREQQSIRLSECRREANDFANEYEEIFMSLNKIFLKGDDCFAVYKINKTVTENEYDFKLIGLSIRDIFNANNISSYKELSVWDNKNTEWKIGKDEEDCTLYSQLEKYKDYDFEKYIELVKENNQERCKITDEGKEIVKNTWKELTGEEL